MGFVRSEKFDIMDIIKARKKGIQKKHIIVGAALVVFILLAYQAFFAERVATLNVDADKLNVEAVSRGTFHNYITVTGNVEPIATIFLDAREGGRVEEKVIEEGTMVKKGDVILHLSNPDLTLSILNSEAQLAEKSNFLRNTMVVMEQEKLQIKRELLNLEYDIKRKKRVYGQKLTLYKDSLISKEEFLISQEDYEFAQRSYELYLERQKQDSIYRKIQIEQMEGNLHNMDLNLKLVRQRQQNLDVTAPVDGQLTTLDVELGQSVPKGSRIGQIHILSSYKVVA